MSDPTLHSGVEIVSSRVFRVSRAVLFDAFADPKKLEQWWGPDEFSNTFHLFDFREGGKWEFTMHGPDETKFLNDKEFVEIVPNERIVLRHIQPTHLFTMTISFADAEGGALLTWKMVFDSYCGENLQKFIACANEQNFDRLEKALIDS